MRIRWDPEKSGRLKKERGVSFEEIVLSDLLGTIKHPGRSHQRILLFDYGGYVWAVPCVVNAEEMFLKTLYRSRKYKRMIERGELP